MPAAQQIAWSGSFGDEYTARNVNADGDRAKIWRRVFLGLPFKPKSVLEVGANVGHNLRAIKDVFNVELHATEPNDTARSQLLAVAGIKSVTADYADRLNFWTESIDVVMTCGVLIHVPRRGLEKSLKEIGRVAGKAVILAEYFSPGPEMINYRGVDDMLWRDDYGERFLECNPDWRTHMEDFAWKRTTGMDNLTIWSFVRR